jgi:hypothetical protein
MLSREEIFRKIIEDEAISAAVLKMSALYPKGADVSDVFPSYFRVSAALADKVNELGLTTTNVPPGAVGIAKLVPMVTMAMPGFHDGFTSHWGDEYLKMNGTPEVFFEEAGLEAREKGEAGEANYLHGLLVLDLVGDLIIQMAGTHLMVAAAVNIQQGLESTNGEFKA